MAHYLVQQHMPGSAISALPGDAVRMQSRGGRGVQLLMTFYAAEDETCFRLFDALSSTAVRRAMAASGAEVDRIVGVVAVGELADRRVSCE
jgi:hypothetical protein